jgi:hypothetical protein
MEAKKAFDNNSSNAELTSAWSNAPLLGSLKIIFDPACFGNKCAHYNTCLYWCKRIEKL